MPNQPSQLLPGNASSPSPSVSSSVVTATPSDQNNSSTINIPQLLVICDQVHNTYKHPIIHYVFEDEPFPDIAKDKLIVVDFDAANPESPKVESYSPHFQISHCRMEQSKVNDQFDQGTAGLFNLILEGVSAPQANEAIESLQPVQNVDNLKEMIFNFKNRNELVKKVFQHQQLQGQRQERQEQKQKEQLQSSQPPIASSSSSQPPLQ